jgi:hypothetical protein
MRDTTMTVQRAKATIRKGLPVEIQNMTWKTATENGSQSPYDAFWIRTTGGGTVDVRRGDLLIDEGETDPLTGNNTQYRVFGRPVSYGASVTRMSAEQIIGT